MAKWPPPSIRLLAVSADLGLALLPERLGLPARIALLLGGVLLNGLAVAVYVGARLGPGPRDGLMTGLSAATGLSLRRVRTLIEVAVLAAGWLLGGTVGVGTVLYALAVGPLTQFFMPRFAYVRGSGGADGPQRPRQGTRVEGVEAVGVPDVHGGGGQDSPAVRRRPRGR